MDDIRANEIREHRKAYLDSCRKIESESILNLAVSLGISEREVRSVWFEIKGEKN
jgi:hypothetical protein